MTPILEMTIKNTGLPHFFMLFEKGVLIKIQSGKKITDLLIQDLDVPSEYLENRLQTVFLDGKAVDHLEEASVQDGSTLALSAAMPGLVGATLRRGGAFASLRQSITLSPASKTLTKKKGHIVLKLFNLVIPELAPRILAKGIELRGDQFLSFLEGLNEAFWEKCQNLVLNGHLLEKPLRPGELAVQPDHLILLKVRSYE